MLTGNVEIDPVALYTADELYDLDDETIRSRRRTSPAVYQELQARVRRLHRTLQGLVRRPHPRTGAIVDAVAVELPTVRSAAPSDEAIDQLAEALRTSARRFLQASAGADAGVGPDGPSALAEVWTGGRQLHLLEFSPVADADARCWDAGGVVAEAPLPELLRRLLVGSTPG